ncbi:MAG: YvcK family protein [Coriobacteriaceae bacterium]|nr:YvcK family protein [Coriobacteriaceae bacterium]
MVRASLDRHAPLHRRGQDVLADRAGLHRWPAPQRRPRRGDGDVPARARLSGHRQPPGHRQGSVTLGSRGAGRRAVAVGGGTGLPRVLSALLALGFDVAAVVTMADDGGSSGLLRRELGILPPGDVRNCLVALAAEPGGTLARVFGYRFAQGEGLAGHALGNLVIAALADVCGGFPEAVAETERLLGCRGQVLPSTLDDVLLHALDSDGREVRGQAAVARSASPVARVYLEPASPGAYPPVLDVLRQADLVVVGPGSLYTSIIPNFLVGGVADALRACSGTRVYVCNVANQRGETSGMDAAGHVKALMAHGLAGALDAVVVHDCPGHAVPEGVEPVCAGAESLARIRALGCEVVGADLADADGLHHSVDALMRVLAEVDRVVHR